MNPKRRPEGESAPKRIGAKGILVSAADERALRRGIVATARAMNAAGINRGRSGNVSARLRNEAVDGFLITPTGFRYDVMGDNDLVAVALDGTVTGLVTERGVTRASEEWLAAMFPGRGAVR